MNQSKKYLTFRLHNSIYGIEAMLVQEIFPLPELIPIAGANTDVIGIFPLRNQIIPVLHLDLLWGYPLQDCRVSDFIIVIQWEGLQIGILVHQVYEMLELDNDVIETPDGYEILGNNDSFLLGTIQIETETILLLDSQKLVRQPDALLTLIWDAESQCDLMAASMNGQIYNETYKQLEGMQFPSFYDLYCPNATLEERKIFQQRALEFQEIPKESESAPETISLAVIGFGNEYFGLDLELVREFTNIYNFTPIPCCPKHIIGNMNLRGDIITLVDIRNVLNLPTPPVKIGSKAVVVQVDDIVAGLPVDKVFEVVDFTHDDLTPLQPSAVNDSMEYFQGMAPFEESVLCILDLPKILTKGGLMVNEEI
ncbi:hypothetical protein NUACC21_53770 [Scytonema sp. NUACC21]